MSTLLTGRICVIRPMSLVSLSRIRYNGVNHLLHEKLNKQTLCVSLQRLFRAMIAVAWRAWGKARQGCASDHFSYPAA